MSDLGNNHGTYFDTVQELPIKEVYTAITHCYFGETEKLPDPDDIIDAVCSYYQVSVEDIKGPDRRHNVVTARHVATYLIRTMTCLSLLGIGELINRHYSTVNRAIHKVETRVRSDRALFNTMRDIASNVRWQKK